MTRWGTNSWPCSADPSCQLVQGDEMRSRKPECSCIARHAAKPFTALCHCLQPLQILQWPFTAAPALGTRPTWDCQDDGDGHLHLREEGGALESIAAIFSRDRSFRTRQRSKNRAYS